MAYGNVLQSMLDTDGDFARLSKSAKLLWFTICATALGGKAGFIAKRDFTILARQSGLDESEVETAMAECIANGSVIQDGDHVWIRNRIKHRCNSTGWRQAAYREATEFAAKSPALSALCIATHGLSSSGIKMPANQSKVPAFGADGKLLIKEQEPKADV